MRAADQGGGPVRTCVGCRTRLPAGTLVRVALGSDGSLAVSRVAPGRGAWLCGDPQTKDPDVRCLEAAIDRNAFRRAYRVDVADAALRALKATVRERAIMVSTQQLSKRNKKGLTQ